MGNTVIVQREEDLDKDVQYPMLTGVRKVL